MRACPSNRSEICSLGDTDAQNLSLPCPEICKSLETPTSRYNLQSPNSFEGKGLLTLINYTLYEDSFQSAGL